MKETIYAVQRMQDHIHEHLGEEITLADLARASAFSPWYAHRLFRQETGLTPAEYIRRLRLSRSALRLRDGGVRVLDVALDLGFGSVDGYQRAFRRAFGCNPAEYARSPRPIALFVPFSVVGREMRKEPMKMEQVQPVFIREVHKPARRVIVKRGREAKEYFAYCEEVGCDVWGLLTSMDSLCGEPVCMWMPPEGLYMQGVEWPAGDPRPVPEGLDAIDLPACDYLLFQGEPFQEEYFREAISAVWQAIDRFDPARMGYAWDDSQPRIQLEPRGERGYMELRPVRKL